MDAKIEEIHDNIEIKFPKNSELSKLKEITDDLKRNDGEIIKPDIQYIETTSANALFEQNFAGEVKSLAKSEGKSDTDESKRGGLSEDQKAKIKENNPEWPNEIIDAIDSWEEYEIYVKANLKVEYINGKPCLIKTDINMEQTDIKGRTNRERMEQGLAPLDKNGRPIELHHIGQKEDSPLAELTFEEHHCNGNDTILHDKNLDTEVHGEGNNWQEERKNHWETRSSQN
jgi:hypothetical protein